MKLFPIFFLLGIFCGGCARMPEGSVATDVSSRLATSDGEIGFAISAPYVAAKRNASFEIGSFVGVFDESGSVQCIGSLSPVENSTFWFDIMGQRWVKLSERAKVTYVRSRIELLASVNGIEVARCNIENRQDLSLVVYFDVDPTPLGWGDESMPSLIFQLPDAL